MDDLRRAMRSLDSVEAPDLWPEIERRAAMPEPAPIPGAGRFQSMFSATRFIVAGAILALFGGFLLAGVVTQPSDDTGPAVSDSPAPTATRPAQLPAEIPDGVEWGMLETPAGPARWVHLVGDDSSLPAEWLPMVHTPAGFTTVELGGELAKVWRSGNLIEWTSELIDVEAEWGTLSRSEGTYWLAVNGPAGLWRSADTQTWEPVLVDGLTTPGPDGSAWSLALHSPITYDGSTFVPFDWTPDYRRVTASIKDAEGREAHELHPVEPGLYEFFRYDSGAIATVALEEAKGGLRIVDSHDGAELAFLDGISKEFVRSIAVGDIQAVTGLAELTADGLTEVPMPAERIDSWSWGVTADDAGLLAYSVGGDGLVHVHRSRDGRDWVESDLIGDDPGEPTDIEGIWSWRGAVSLGDERGEWTQRDDGEWEFAGPPGAPDFDGWSLGDGWLQPPFGATGPVGSEQLYGPGGTIARTWYQPRGEEPIPFDISEMGIPAEGCDGTDYGGEALLSANTVVTLWGCGDTREAWVLTFDEVPA